MHFQTWWTKSTHPHMLMYYPCILLLYEHSCFSSYVSSVFSRLSRLRASLGLRKQPNSTERACKFGGLAPSWLSGCARAWTCENDPIPWSESASLSALMAEAEALWDGVWLIPAGTRERIVVESDCLELVTLTWRRWSPTSLLFSSSIPAERRILQHTFVLNMLLLP